MSNVDSDPETLVYDVMPFARNLGIEPVSVGVDEVRARLGWTEGRCTGGGVLHGGALVALADSTAAM